MYGFVSLPCIPPFHDVFRPLLAGIRILTTFSCQLRISETPTNFFRHFAVQSVSLIGLRRLDSSQIIHGGRVRSISPKEPAEDVPLV
jgi:hypothetical protein